MELFASDFDVESPSLHYLIGFNINLSGKLALKERFKCLPEFNRTVILTRRKIDTSNNCAKTQDHSKVKVATFMSKKETAGESKLGWNFLWKLAILQATYLWCLDTVAQKEKHINQKCYVV